MPIVNYVREHTRFIQYASDEHIPANERLLWYALMHIMNMRAQGNVWPDEFIRINNDLLLSYCAMRYDTMAAARNGLKQRGLIDYEPGKKNIKSPAYRMIYFYPEFVPPKSESYDVCYPIKSDNIGGNIGGKPCYNIGGNIPNNIINYTKDNVNQEDENDHENDYQRAREEAKEAWKLYLGKSAAEPSDYAISHMASTAVYLYHFQPGVIKKAVRLAAQACVESPFAYVHKLFVDWSSYHLQTEDEVDEYLFYRDAVAGKLNGVISPEDAAEQLRIMKEKRSCRQYNEDRSYHLYKEDEVAGYKLNN